MKVYAIAYTFFVYLSLYLLYDNKEAITMAISKLHEDILHTIDHTPLITDEELASMYQLSVHDIHIHIREINLDQTYIEDDPHGYYLNKSLHNQWKKLRTTIVYGDYEIKQLAPEHHLNVLKKDIVIVGSYYLYEPISSSKTELMINTTAYHPPMEAPIVYVSPRLDRHDIRTIRTFIQNIKREAIEKQ